MALFLVTGVILICGILTVQQRAEEEGTSRGFKSFFALVITIICVLIALSGRFYILGVPVAYYGVKYFAKRI